MRALEGGGGDGGVWAPREAVCAKGGGVQIPLLRTRGRSLASLLRPGRGASAFVSWVCLRDFRLALAPLRRPDREASAHFPPAALRAVRSPGPRARRSSPAVPAAADTTNASELIDWLK